MTSIQRVLTTLGHQEPDRVPFFLLATMHGARELGLSIRDYFASPENVAEGQLRLRAKYQHDCLYGFYYAPVEMEAWGGEVIFSDDGPPNSGSPLLRCAADIRHLVPPEIGGSPILRRVLRTLELLKKRSGGDALIVGVVMSPFSLPVMQLGFDRYLDLLLEQPEEFERLVRINEDFCVAWANAQLAAGANAICYFDPVSSSTIIPPHLYEKTGFIIAQRTLARIKGPAAIHLASGATLPICDYLAKTGAASVGVSAMEDLAALKDVCRGKIALLGNLNGIAMRHWSDAEAETAVKAALAAGGPGGGFILSDNHGEIPWQVPEATLAAVSEAVRRWGEYPLTWASEYGRC